MERYQEELAVKRWVARTLRPHVTHTRVILGGGPIGKGRLDWKTFSCLYPTSPKYRLFTARPSRPAEEEFLREEVLSIQLPPDVTRSYDIAAADLAWRAAQPLSQTMGIPLGMYMTGRYFPDPPSHKSRAVGALWHISTLPTVLVVKRLKQAARTVGR